MKTTKEVIFWIISISIFIERFIRYFINPNISRSIQNVVHPLPLVTKIIIVILFGIFMYWLAPKSLKSKKD
ncbi:hypothetical protein F5ESL0233_00565 [Lactobacillus sp. ESL0233]|nr:hypothetical protein F5ESL0233_00565 [Lactobacillus sp. ESL0233]